MSRLKRAYFVYMGFITAFMLNPMYVFASANRGAVADIMNDDRFDGAIKSISWLTERVDHYFTMVITATAFFIISSALLKNVCAGAYCSNHKFWDKVAEAHEKSEAISLQSTIEYFRGKQFMQTSVGGIRDGLLGLVPNIKAFTDFDDADIEPKAYFMKAIPQMCGCVIIGVFVYNGYYRDTAAKVGSFGSEICERVFSSVDPVSFVDKITQTTGNPPCSFENDPTLEGTMCKDMANAIYTLAISEFDIRTSAEKTATMRSIEVWVKGFVEKYRDDFLEVTDKTEFKLTNLKVLISSDTQTGFIRQFVKDDDGNKYFQYQITWNGAGINTNAVDLDQSGKYSFIISGNLELTKKTTDKVDSDVTPMAPEHVTATKALELRVKVQNVQTGKVMKKHLVDVNVPTNELSGCISEGWTFESVDSYSGYDDHSGDTLQVYIQEGTLLGSRIQGLSVKCTVKKTSDDGTTVYGTIDIPIILIPVQ